MNRSILTNRRRISICATSIVAFMVASPQSPAVDYFVPLGDTVTEAAVVGGATGLNKTGGGTLVLANANTYTGVTTISNGSIVITAPTGLGVDTSTVLVTNTNPNPLSTNLRGFPGGSLVLNGLGGGFTLARDLSLQGFGPISDRGAALINIGDNTLTGSIFTGLPNGSTPVGTRIIPAEGTLTIAGPLNIGGIAATTITNIGGLNQAGVGFTRLTGPLLGTGTLETSGGGAFRLDPSDTTGFSGTIRISGSAASGQSTLRISSDGVLGTRTAGGTGSVLDMNGGILVVLMDTPSLTTGGAPANVYGRASSAYFIDHSVGGTAQNGTLTLGTLTFEDGNTQTFNGRNGYGFTFGAANVNGGDNNSTFNNNLQGGAVLTFNGNFWNNTNNTGNRAFSLGGNGDTRINGNIVAAAAAFDHSFTKSGTGTLTITGTASTLDGAFNINGGTVAVNSFGAFGPGTSTAPINIGTGGTAGTLTFLGSAATGAGETTARTINLASTSGATRINASQTGSGVTPLVITSDITVNGGAGSKTLTLAGVSITDNEISGSIPNGGAGGTTTVNVTKGDEGTWVLSGTNTYTGNTTITEGRLKIRANGAASTVLSDTSNIVFNVDGTDQSAGGTLEFVGAPGVNSVETVGALVPTAGMGRIRLTPGAGGTASLTFSSLGGVSSLGASVNVIAPTALDVVRITAQPTGFVRGNVYYNGSNYAYSDAGALRAPIYGTDAGFVTSATTLTDAAHNEITGNVTAAGPASINSLRITGNTTIDMGANLLTINNGPASVGGILVAGGNATITGTGGVTQGLGNAPNGGGLVIRVDGVTDSLNLATPITNSTVGGLTKSGLGTLILSAANNQNGNTEILEGTIQLAPGGRLSPANRNLTIRKIGTLDLNGINTGTSIAAFNGTGRVTNSNAAPAVLTVGNNNQGGTFSGTIEDGAGQLSVVKEGTGTMTWNSLTGVNTYTGFTRINSTGLINADVLAHIGQPSSIGRGDATSDASNAASLVFAGASATGLSGGLNYTGPNVVTNRLFTLAGTAANSGARINASGLNGSGLTFSNTGAISYAAGAATVAQHLTLGGNSSGDNRMNLQLVNPGGAASAVLSVRKVDASTWNFGNTSNSYSGQTIINQGRLVADALALPSTSPLVFTAVNADLLGGVFHSSGTLARNVVATPVNGVGTVSFLAESPTTRSGSGGFAASEGKFTVNLGAVTWDAGGFMTAGSAAAVLRLNSAIATDEVELVSAINLNGAQRTVLVDDNTNIGADFATMSGVLSGAGAGINKTGAGILALRGANTFTGNTNITSGTLTVTSLGNSGSAGASSVGDSTAGNSNTGAVTLGNGGTGGAILQYVGAGEVSDRKIRLNATTGSTQIHSDGAGPLILTNVANDMVDGNKTLFLRGTNASGNRIESVLANSGTGTLGVTVDGSATWILTAANTYSGVTTSGAGALGIGNDAALGTGTLNLSNGVVFAYGADRTIANQVNHVNNTTQGFIGDNSLTFADGLTAQVSANNISTNNNIVAGKSLTFNGVTANSLTANRAWVLDGAGRTVINGPITSTTTFGLTINKAGEGTLVLNSTGSNFTQNGAVLDIDDGIVILGANEAIPDGPGFGGVVFSPDAGQDESPTLNLNGFSETLNSLVSTGTSASTIDNGSAVATTLTIGANDGTVNYGGAITNSGGGALTIVKTGTAAGVLGGTALSYSGPTQVLGGSLAFTGADPSNTTSITVAGDAGLSLINGAGTPISGLTALNLGGGSGTAALGLDIGTTSDTLTVVPGAVTANTVNLSLGAAPGLATGSYTLLSAPAGGLSGATYALNGFVPGGFTYSLSTSNTAVVVNAAAAAVGTFFWRGDVDGSWSRYIAGNTNWEGPGGADPASTPGPFDVVVFSSTLNPPASNAFVTTLDNSYTIDSLQFNGSNASTTAARVSIAPGIGNNSLTINPASSSDGIEVSDNGGIASITAPIVVAADQSWTVGSIGTPRPELIVTGPLSGTGNITKLGAGTATVTGVSTRTGRTSIDNGTLRINGEAALGADPAVPTPNQLSLNGGTLRSTATFAIDDPNRGITIGANGGSFDTSGGSITVSSANVVSGTGVLRKEGGNTLILNGANSYTGGTIVNGGAARAGDNAAFGPGDVTLANTGTLLEVADGVSVPNALVVSDTGNDKTIRLLAGANSGTVAGAITVQENTFGNFRAQASGTGVLTISGVIENGAGTVARGLRVNEAGGNTGTVVLSGANTYTGPTEVRQGTLRNGASDVVGGSLTVNAAVSGSPTATYDLAGNNETLTGITFGATGSSNAANVNTVTTGAGTLTLGGNVTTVAGNAGSQAVLAGNVALSATRTFTVADAANQDADLLVTAALTGPGGLTKAGTGTLQMTGASTYAGTTTINAGAVVVDGSISGAVTTNGGTLAGTGSVAAITGTSGTVAPGALGSIGSLQATSLTMSGSTTFDLDINTTAPAVDLLAVSGPLTLNLAGTPLSLQDLGGAGTLGFGTKFTFLTYNGTWNGGLFSIGGTPIADDSGTFTFGSNTFGIDYNDAGNMVSLVVVPEPGIAASLAGGFGMLVGLQRFRRRRSA